MTGPGSRQLGVAVGIAIGMGLGGACLVAPNPDFMGETEGASGADGQGCPAGTLDCDDEPGCETPSDDPQTCGSCTRVCELPGFAPVCANERCWISVELDIVDDTHLDAEQPEQNFGAATTLRIDATHEVLLGLPSLSGLPGPGEIQSIGLRSTVITAGAEIELHRVEGPWAEDSVTKANAPMIDGAVLTRWTPTPGSNTIELLGLLGAWQNGSPQHSLGLVASSEAGPDPAATVLFSSEGASPPVIVVTLAW